MFRCQATGKLSQPGESSHKLVVQIRSKTYLQKDKYGNEIPVGQGTEIVKEITVCKEFYDAAIAKGFKPDVVKS